MMCNHSGAASGGGTLDLVRLFSLSHSEHWDITSELYRADMDQRRIIRLRVTIDLVIAAVLLLVIADGSVFGNKMGLRMAALATLCVFAFFQIRRSLKERVLKTDTGSCLPRFARLTELLWDMGFDLDKSTRTNATQFPLRLDMVKREAEERALQLAKDLHHQEERLGNHSVITNQTRALTHEALFILSVSGLIAKDWKGTYLARSLEKEGASH